MKYLVLTFFSLAIISSCKNDSSSAKVQNSISKSAKIISPEKVEDFKCASFFNEGDYSSLCFIDAKTPVYFASGCIIDFETKGDKQKQGIKIQFVDKKSSPLAEMHLNLRKGNYAKGEIVDVSNVGDATFFDIHGTDLKSLSWSNKDLHVRYKNITFVIMAEYLTSSEKLCFFNDQDLVAFATKIIENL